MEIHDRVSRIRQLLVDDPLIKDLVDLVLEYAQYTRDDLDGIPDGMHMCMLNLTVHDDYDPTSQLMFSYKGEVKMIRTNYQFYFEFTKDGNPHAMSCFCHVNNTMLWRKPKWMVVLLEY